MPTLFKNTNCQVCGHRHHFGFLGDDVTLEKEYSYVCPETGAKASLHSGAGAEIVLHLPQGVVALEGTMARPARAGSSEVGPTALQEVLPEIQDVATKVGGMEHLSEIVETLKKPQG